MIPMSLVILTENSPMNNEPKLQTHTPLRACLILIKFIVANCTNFSLVIMHSLPNQSVSEFLT